MRAVPYRVWCGRWLLRCCRRCCVGSVKGATRLENIFIGRDGARVKALLGELDNFDYDTNSFVHERFNEAKEKNDDYPGELDSFVYGRVYEEREWDDEDLRMISTPSSMAFV